MSNQSANNKRIAKNSFYLYVRMLLVMGVTLYTSRVVLQVLGITDFGIYNVVGGFVAILGFFTSSLSNATQRYISVGLGNDNAQETERTFRQSFTLLLILSLLILFLGETVGLWFVANKLVIPPARLDAAIWVYQFSLLSVICSINQVALMGSVIAHEKMGIYAYIGLFEAVARLVVAFLLMTASSIDALILYGALTAFISVLIYVFYLIYSIRNFNECRISLYWDKKLVKDIGSFIGYNLFGCLAWSAGIQGTNIILNIFFGPTVNAARAVSVQVSAVVTRFTENIMTAVKPQIIKSYVVGDREYMFLLIEKSSKYAFFLAALLAIPIMFEIEYILELWLGQVPENSAIFTRLVLCDALVGVFAPSLWIAANATGNIKNNQVYGRMLTLFILPISYLMLLVYANPIVPFAVTILSSTLYWGYCFYDINRQIGLNVCNYIIAVIKPSLILSLVLIMVGTVIKNIITDISFCRLIINFVVSIFVGIITIFVLLQTKERVVVLEFLNTFLNRGK